MKGEWMSGVCCSDTVRRVFFFQAEDGIRDSSVTGVQTCALPIYSEIIFFETAPAFTDFKKGTLALAAQASAVAATKGASTNAKYQNGVAVFTTGKGGPIFEPSVGRQHFGFDPFRQK